MRPPTTYVGPCSTQLAARSASCTTMVVAMGRVELHGGEVNMLKKEVAAPFRPAEDHHPGDLRPAPTVDRVPRQVVLVGRRPMVRGRVGRLPGARRAPPILHRGRPKTSISGQTRGCNGWLCATQTSSPSRSRARRGPRQPHLGDALRGHAGPAGAPHRAGPGQAIEGGVCGHRVGPSTTS